MVSGGVGGVNMGFPIGAGVLGFFLVLRDAKDTIYHISVSNGMLKTLKGLPIASNPTIILCSSSLLGGLTCLGVTDNCYISNSY